VQQKYFDKIKSRQVVVIDDLDKEASAWSLKLLYDLLDSRQRQCLPTIFTANRGLTDVNGESPIKTFWRETKIKADKSKFEAEAERDVIIDRSEAIHSRVMGRIWAEVVLVGEDYRVQKHKLRGVS